jgi:hypothetical protein
MATKVRRALQYLLCLFPEAPLVYSGASGHFWIREAENKNSFCMICERMRYVAIKFTAQIVTAICTEHIAIVATLLAL